MVLFSRGPRWEKSCHCIPHKIAIILIFLYTIFVFIIVTVRAVVTNPNFKFCMDKDKFPNGKPPDIQTHHNFYMARQYICCIFAVFGILLGIAMIIGGFMNKSIVIDVYIIFYAVFLLYLLIQLITIYILITKARKRTEEPKFPYWFGSCYHLPISKDDLGEFASFKDYIYTARLMNMAAAFDILAIICGTYFLLCLNAFSMSMEE